MGGTLDRDDASIQGQSTHCCAWLGRWRVIDLVALVVCGEGEDSIIGIDAEGFEDRLSAATGELSADNFGTDTPPGQPAGSQARRRRGPPHMT